MSHDEMSSQLLNVAEPLSVTFAYVNPTLRLVWFQVNRAPEEVAEHVLVVRLLNGLTRDHFSLERTGSESLIGLRIQDGYEEFPELFGRIAQTLATCLSAPFNLTFLFKDMHPATSPMRLPDFAKQFGLETLLEDLYLDPEAALIDELEASFTEVMSSRTGESE